MSITSISSSLAPVAGSLPSAASTRTSKPATGTSGAASAPAPTKAPAPASSPQAAAGAAASLIASSYSVTVAGRSYSGAISRSNGQYTIAVANLPGATVTAPSLQAAEIALTVKVDTLA